mgnify:CR=1 FL=1
MGRRILAADFKKRVFSFSADEFFYRRFCMLVGDLNMNVSNGMRMAMQDFMEKHSVDTKKMFAEIAERNTKLRSVRAISKISALIIANIFFFVSLSALATANGLVLQTPSVSVNKTYGVDLNISLNITNTEPFAFFNVTFADNLYIRMSRIPVINSGETVTANATIFYNENIQSTARLTGRYFSSIGQQFLTYDINVSANGQLSPCDMSITEGDIVRWRNMLQFDPIVQYSISGQQLSSPLQPGQQYSKTFQTPEVLTYYWARFSFPVTPICTISANPASGYIYNPELDAILRLTLTIDFRPTTIQLIPAESSFVMNFADTRESSLVVRNTGGDIANSIHLAGEWLTFSANDFSLASGASRAVIFTIRPAISTTEETNKSYTKNITASGNFQTASLPLNIFINYSNLGIYRNSTDAEYLIRVFCPLFPHSSLCEQDPRVVYVYLQNSSSQAVNVSVTQQKMDSLWEYLFRLGDDIQTYQNFNKGKQEDIVNSNALNANATAMLQNQYAQNEIDRQQNMQSIIYLIIFVFVIFSALAVFVLIYVYKNKKALENVRRWN